MKRRRSTLCVETLEDRCTPTTWGNPWPDAPHLTLSFAPDGTLVAGRPSILFQTMNAIAPTSAWETAILKAFQSWAARANIEIAVVTDDGSPLGTTGSIQGDAAFGDIRIAAYAMAPGAIAQSTPFQIDAGTWSGDVNFNSAASFSLTGARDGYDLFSVALHEAGHVFGFDESGDPASVMYPTYTGVHTDLGPSDFSGIQDLYGARIDAGNDSFQTAIPLTDLANGNGTLSMVADGSLASLDDRAFYSFQTTLSFGKVYMTVRNAGISLLTPRVTVFDSFGNTIVTAADSDPQEGGFTIRLTNVLPLSTYYIKVESGQDNPFGVGTYQLTVSKKLYTTFSGSVNATVNHGANAVNDLLDPLHANTSFAKATPLTPTHTGPNSSAHYTARGTLNGSQDAAFYELQAPANDDSSDVVLSAMVWGLQKKINPRVKVFDADENLLPSEVIVNDGTTYAVQFVHARPRDSYFIEVVRDATSNGAGNYFLGVDFSPNPLVLQHQVAGSLGNANPFALKTFDSTDSDRTSLFHFILSANATTNFVLQMTLTNGVGQVVFTLTAGTTEATTQNVLLAPGVYYATFKASSSNGPIPAAGFLLRGDILTAPNGPEATDTTGAPGSGSTPGGGPPPIWNNGSTGGPTDPPSDPYTSAPVVTLINPADKINRAGDSVQLTLSATDSANNPLTFSATGLPPGLTVNPVTGIISGAIANNARRVTPYVVMITATDSTANRSATQSFYWTANPPIITADNPGDQMTGIGSTVNLAIFATCTDGAPLTFSAANLPPGLTIDPNTGVISGVIADDADCTNPYVVVIVIFDASSGTTLQLTFSWTVF